MAVEHIETILGQNVASDRVKRVKTARVVIADYALLQQDFPELRVEAILAREPALRRMSEQQQGQAIEQYIDEWIVGRAGVISEAQAKQTTVNTPIETEERAYPAYRPPRYGRACVINVDAFEPTKADEAKINTDASLRFIDIKGMGVSKDRTPSTAPHSNGLEYLGVALGDYVLSSVISSIFERHAPGLSVLPTYAVIDLGFDVVGDWRGTDCAGLHVRRVHRRPDNGMSLPSANSPQERTIVFTEMLLRTFGFTSTNRGNCLTVARRDAQIVATSNGQDLSSALNSKDQDALGRLLHGREHLCVERINLQFAKDPRNAATTDALYDFGHINVRGQFNHAVASTVHDRWLCIGGILYPDDEAFVTPHPAARASLGDWHRYVINAWCFQLARQFRAHEVSSARIRQNVQEKVDAFARRWPTAPLDKAMRSQHV